MSRPAGPAEDDLQRPSYTEAVEQGASASNRAQDVRVLIESIGESASNLSLSRRPSRTPAAHLGLQRMSRTSCGAHEITALAFSPDGLVAVSRTAVDNGTTEIWDFNAPQKICKLNGPHAIFTATPGLVASVSEPHATTNTKGMYKFQRAEIAIKDYLRQRTVSSPPGALSLPVAFSSNGKMMAAAVGQNRLMIYDTGPSPQHIMVCHKLCMVTSHIDHITDAMFTPDGENIVTTSSDSTLRVSNARTGRTVRRLEIEGSGSTRPRALGISADGQAIVSIWGNQVHIWEPEMDSLNSYSLNVVRQKEGWPICISPDCRYLACRTEDGMDISDVYTGKVLAAIEVAPTMESMVTTAAFSMDGNMFALGRYNGFVEVWEMMAGK